MNVQTSAFRFLLFFIALFAFANVSALELSPTSVEIFAGAAAKVTVSNASGTVSAFSSNSTIASVSYSRGIASIKGINAGLAKITVKDRRTSKQVEVTVKSAPLLTATPTSVTVNVKGIFNITVSNASGTVSVVSSKPSVAAASYAGSQVTVTGIAPGSATLTIKDSKTTLTVPVTVQSNTPPPPAAGNYTLLAWNDLGMHCMDGMDFSVFTILPPYNTLHAQLKDKAGRLISSGVNLTYEAIADSTGSINTYSSTKTNFWDWVGPLFGLNPAPEVGLNLDGLATGTPEPGNKTPSLVPAAMTYNADFNWFEAEGIPMTPFPDNPKIDANGREIKNFYPTVKVVAKDLSGNVLATTTTVLPVSDEMTCKGCHASTTATDNPAQIAAKPAAGWVNDLNPDKDWKRNILRLHDERELSTTLFQSALIEKGFNTQGLLATADSGKPVLCVGCHASNAYFDKRNKITAMPGLAGIKPFTQALHLKHAGVGDPSSTTRPQQATLD
ncbi:MAG: Ig-like domain-containing protein, partial [Methylococcales bacterium]|nr:Ig-like domain-containing protein [Methylococcales bacterium]